jgi:hypothetical protein
VPAKRPAITHTIAPDAKKLTAKPSMAPAIPNTQVADDLFLGLSATTSWLCLNCCSVAYVFSGGEIWPFFLLIR